MEQVDRKKDFAEEAILDSGISAGVKDMVRSLMIDGEEIPNKGSHAAFLKAQELDNDIRASRFLNAGWRAAEGAGSMKIELPSGRSFTIRTDQQEVTHE